MNPAAIQLTVRKGGATLFQCQLEPGEYLLGRDPACPVPIPSPEVSRKHAKLAYVDGRLEIEDVGGRYGTFVDNRRINGRVQIQFGQIIALGKTEIEIQPVAESQPQPESTSPPSTPEIPRYEILQTLSQGGMGIVYQALDHQFQRPVALKMAAAKHGDHPDIVRRFVQEAIILGRLEHPNIVPIYDLGTDSHGRNYYAMKFVPGSTLKEILAGLRANRAEIVGQHRLRELLVIFRKICDAVAYSHSKRIIHRDLKPANIIVGNFGEVLVLDWGLAKILGEPEPDPTKCDLPTESPTKPSDTRYGTIIGTPNFMSPEQAEGRVQAMDERTDIFNLGAILYDILTLRPPFTANNEQELLAKIKAGHPAAPVSYNPTGKKREPFALVHCPHGRIPDSLSAVAMKALNHDPEKRYQTVEELQREVAAYQSDHATTAEHAGFFRQLRLGIRRHPTLASVAAVTILLTLSAAAIFAKRAGATNETLGQLRRAAPLYHQLARQSLVEQRPTEALEKIQLAIQLEPTVAEHRRLKADVLQTLLHFAAAKTTYAEAIRLGDTSQQTALNYQWSDRLAAEANAANHIPLHVLHALQKQFVQQQRTAESQLMAARIEAEKNSAWTRANEGIKPFGFSRLTRDSLGYLKLNLSRTPVRDLKSFTQLPVTSLNLWEVKVQDLRPLRGMPLQELYLAFTAVSDLEPLRGMPINALTVSFSPVSGIEPLRGMPLIHLHLSGTKVTDLGPLSNLALQSLHLDRTPVDDIAPLSGTPLRELRLDGCERLVDLRALATCSELEQIILPPNHGPIDFLRQMPKLKRISYRYDSDPMKVERATSFWKTHDLAKR
ncbi:MAG: FHA domain-containing protein [Pedosphaera sp.]|nr:FHA domain-containing protein [Pedosphaera sp.]